MTPERAAESITRWADLGRGIRAAHAREVPSWAPAAAMVKAARDLWACEEERVNRLLQESDARLRPFSDPLHTDYGAHRWLYSEREEAYSDWLAWIVERMESAEVARLFGWDPQGVLDGCGGHSVKREEVIAGRRLDLVVRFGEAAILVVEVKTRSGSDEPNKLHDYWVWLQGQPAEHKEPVLLVPWVDGDCDPGSFRPLTWRDVCLELRQFALRVIEREKVREDKQDMTLPAMVLAFVGAVEENVLGFSVGRLRSTEAVDHVEAWLRGMEDGDG